MNKKRAITLIFLLTGILFTLPFLAGLTGFAIGMNSTTKLLGLFGLVFIIIAAIIENIEERKLHKHNVRIKSH